MKLDLDDLKQQLDDIHRRYPTFKQDDLFVCWFLRAYLTEDEKSATDAVTGGSGDKSVDAVLVDHKSKAVFLVQGKYRQDLSKKSEGRGDVMGFASVAKPFTDPEPGPFKVLVDKMHPHTAKLLSEARPFVVNNDYRLWMYYVTLGSVSANLEKEAKAVVANATYDGVMEVFDGQRLMHLLRDYLDGVAPPIPTLDLEMEQHSGVKINGVLQRFDSHNNIESWVFSMQGDAVARMFESSGIRLFARNIRGFLGEKTPINVGMTTTLHDEPDHFFYYNNGITIICDRAEKRSRSGLDYLRVSNPQVINGQQTSRMLAANDQKAAKASVLVKVMQVPRHAGADVADGFDTLVSRIVANTNWQNAINYADLVSNDRVQIEIERSLRKVGYMYLRKRQKKSEVRALAGKTFKIIKKDELAQAVAACELDPVVVREGKNELFGTHYQSIFSSTEPRFYLPRYWARRMIAQSSYGHPQRSYAAWMALHFLWSRLAPLLRKEDNPRRFWMLCEKKDGYLCTPLVKACDLIFDELLAYYRANKGAGGSVQDHSTFFRSKRGRHVEFEKSWEWSNGRAARFKNLWEKIEGEIKDD